MTHGLRDVTHQSAHSWRLALHLLVVLAILSFFPASRGHTQHVYTVDIAIGTDTLTGQIVTTGALGVLTQADIIGWDLNLQGVGVSTILTSVGGQSGVGVVGSDLTATAQNLIFNYSGTDQGYFAFQASNPGPDSGQEYTCFNTTWYGCANGASIVPQSYDDPTAQYDRNLSGNLVIATDSGGVPPPVTTYSGSVLFGTGNGAIAGLPPCTIGDPVNCATGNLVETQQDLQVNGRGRALSLVRTFNGLDAASASAPYAMGFGWTHSYAATLSIDGSGNVVVHQSDGSTVPFTKSGSSFTAPAFVIATLIPNSDGTYTFTWPNQWADIFNSTGRLIARTDRNGYKTVLTYNSTGNLTAVTDPAGRSLSFSYTDGGLVSSVTDPIGRIVIYGYDSSNNLIRVTDAGGNVTGFAYDGAHRLTSMTTPNGGVAANHYDASNRVVSQTDPAGRTMTFAYGGGTSGSGTTTITDGDGHVTAQTYTNNRLAALTRGAGTAEAATWTFTYDSAGNRNSGTDPNGHTWHATYDTHGNQLSFADALGRTNSSTYDARNDLMTRTDALGVTTTYTYDANGNTLKRSRPLTGTSQIWTQNLQYGDSNHPGDVTAIVDASGAVWAQSYDSDGDVIRRLDPVNDLWTGSYNGIGWLASEAMPRGNAGRDVANFTVTFAYSPLGQILETTDQLGHVTKFSYDANRNLVSNTDANGHMTHYAYDPDNELIKTTRADGTVLATSFDQAGNMIGQTDGLGHTTSYTFDALNRRITVSDPLGRTTKFGYDGAGNRISETDSSNQTTTMSYDAANELTGIRYSDGKTPAVSFAYDLDGQRQAMTDGTGSSAYQFDSLHRLTGATDGGGRHVGYAYDLRGDLTGMVYPSGKTVTRGFDAAGRLISVTDWSGNKSTFQYDADGNTIGIGYGNGIIGAFGYDRTDRVTSMAYDWVRLSYARDNLGLVTRADIDGLPWNDNYAYNLLNQLSESGPENFRYDPADNVTKLGFAALSYDAANELTQDTTGRSAEALTYDARGNRLSAPGKLEFRYDQENRLTGIGSQVSYVYNGDGLRAGKVVAGVSSGFIWDQAGGLPVLLTDGTLQFIYGARGWPLEQIDADGRVVWFHQDQLGSTLGVTDEHRHIVEYYGYDAYGQRLDDNQWKSGRPGVTPLLFAGQYTDSESDLQYLQARYYDPRTGQFLTRDPKAPVTRTPYLYASGDPVNHTDPTGAQESDVNPGVAYTIVATSTTPASDVGGDSGGGGEAGASCPIGTGESTEMAGPFDWLFSGQSINRAITDYIAAHPPGDDIGDVLSLQQDLQFTNGELTDELVKKYHDTLVKIGFLKSKG